MALDPEWTIEKGIDLNDREGIDQHLLSGATISNKECHSESTIIWKIATCCLTTISLVLFGILIYRNPSSTSSQVNPHGTFEGGFDTEIRNAFSSIELQKVKFSGGLKYDSEGKLYRNIDPVQPQYVGQPGSEMDEAWDHLVNGRYVHFSTEYEGPGYDEALHHGPDDVVEMGVDALHALHCLNRIRKTLDYDHYQDLLKIEGANNRLHVDHCIDYIRQMLQCKADLTPLPVYWTPNAGRQVPDFDRIHTCRNFKKVRDWAYTHDAEIKAKYSESLGTS